MNIQESIVAVSKQMGDDLQKLMSLGSIICPSDMDSQSAVSTVVNSTAQLQGAKTRNEALCVQVSIGELLNGLNTNRFNSADLTWCQAQVETFPLGKIGFDGDCKRRLSDSLKFNRVAKGFVGRAATFYFLECIVQERYGKSMFFWIDHRSNTLRPDNNGILLRELWEIPMMKQEQEISHAYLIAVLERFLGKNPQVKRYDFSGMNLEKPFVADFQALERQFELAGSLNYPQHPKFSIKDAVMGMLVH